MNVSLNLFDLPEGTFETEKVEVLLKNPFLRMERIVSNGQTTDWYDQEEDEWVALLQGSATLTYESGEIQELSMGDTVLIPAHKKHKVSATSSAPPCVWLCLFFKDQNRKV